MDTLNFKHLFYFFVVSKEGSIKSASKKLHVSQPTISDQIKLLEDYWGCKLFDRKNRGLHLTKEGKLALEYAEGIFSKSNELTFHLRNKKEAPKKTLDIGITHLMSPFFIYENLMPLFSQKELSVRIHENKRHLLLAELEEGNVDVVITDSKESLSSSMNSYRVGINRTFAVAHKNLLPEGFSFPFGLNQIPFFNYTSESNFKYEIELFFSKNKVSPVVVGEGDDIDLMEKITSNGLAFTIVPEVAKDRFKTISEDIVVLGELEEFQTSVWGVIKSNNKGIALDFLKNQRSK